MVKSARGGRSRRRVTAGGVKPSRRNAKPRPAAKAAAPEPPPSSGEPADPRADNDGWYYAPHGVDLKAGLSWRRFMGDLEDVHLTLARLDGRTVYTQQDPDIYCMAVSRDGSRLYIQDEFEGRRRHRTIALDGGVVTSEPHPSSASELALLSDFVSRSGEKLPYMSACPQQGPPFLLTRPLELVAARMSDAERHAALEEVAATPAPDFDAWRDVCTLFDGWTGAAAESAARVVSRHIGAWPNYLRSRPDWLDWLAPHPLWSLVADPVSSLSIQNRDVGDEGVRRLLGLQSLARCAHVKLVRCGIGPAGAAHVAGSAAAATIINLSLDDNPIGDEGAVALASAPRLTSLTWVHLANCGIGKKGIEAIARSPNFAGLWELDLHGNYSDAGLREALKKARLRRKAGQS